MHLMNAHINHFILMHYIYPSLDSYTRLSRLKGHAPLTLMLDSTKKNTSCTEFRRNPISALWSY